MSQLSAVTCRQLLSCIPYCTTDSACPHTIRLKQDRRQKKKQSPPSLSERQLLKELRRIEELLSIREVLRGAKQCPSCKMAIAKTEGCNKMVCDNCGKYFCYGCNRAISGYKHFMHARAHAGTLTGSRSPHALEKLTMNCFFFFSCVLALQHMRARAVRAHRQGEIPGLATRNFLLLRKQLANFLHPPSAIHGS